MTGKRKQFLVGILVIFLLGISAPSFSQIASMDEIGRVFLNQQLRDIQYRLNYIEDNTYTDSSITAATFTSGTINTSTINATNINASYITGGTITGGTISGGTITGGTITGGTISGATISALLGEIGGWYLSATTLANNETPGDADILLDSGNGLIRVGDSATSYITIDGANKYIRTSDYASGPLGSGWNVGMDLAEFTNIRARGKISTAVFEKDVISSIGGNFLVSDSDILDSDMTALTTSSLVILDDTTFATGDTLRMKDGVSDEWMVVAKASSAPTYSVLRNVSENNIPVNWEFENWDAGDNVAPSGWTFTGDTIAKEATETLFGSYTAKVTNSGTTGNLYQDIDDALGISYWQNKTVTFGIWMRSPDQGRARLYIDDGVGSSFSDQNSAVGWRWIEAIRTISGSATYVRVRVSVENSGYVYVDGPMALEYPASYVEWTEGTAVVNYGAANEGLIYMTASEANAPHIDVLTHEGEPWTATSTKMRMGNVNGFLGYSSDLYGFAVGESGSYLKYDPTNGLQVKGTVTIESGSSGISNLSDAGALATRNSIVFYQTSEPVSSMKEGDFWIDTDDDNRLYIYNSSAWVDSQDGDIATAQTTADSKVETFRQSGIPTAVTAGDLWIDTDNNKLYRATATGDDQITAGEWELQNAAIATGWSHASDVTKIDGGDIYANTIILAGLGSAVTDNMFDDSTKSDDVQAWIHASDATKIDGGDIYTNSITTNSLAAWSVTANEIDVRTLTADKIVVDALTANEIGGAAIKQGELNTTEQEVSLVWEQAAGFNCSGVDNNIVEEQTSQVSLSAGLYGLYPQLKSTWDEGTADMDEWCVDWGTQVRMSGETGEEGGSKILSESYVTYVMLRQWINVGDDSAQSVEVDATLFAKFKYITSSNETPWLFLLVDKITGDIKASSFAYDPPSVGSEDSSLSHPFRSYDPAKHEVVLVDNEILNIIKAKVKEKHSVLTVINDGYKADMASSPIFEPRVVNEIDEYGDKPGKVIEIINVPDWAKIYTGEPTVEIKQRTISTLPAEIKYRKVKKK